jgi:hypothetical protein
MVVCGKCAPWLVWRLRKAAERLDHSDPPLSAVVASGLRARADEIEVI